MASLPGSKPEPLSPADATAIAAIAATVEACVPKSKHDKAVKDMLDGLGQTDPGRYEPTLTTLGQLLGTDSAKPSAKGRCDSTWCWGNSSVVGHGSHERREVDGPDPAPGHPPGQ